MRISIDHQVQAVLDERRIGADEVQKVIELAQDMTKLFSNRVTGNVFAFFDLSNITYWVEYRRETEVFVVFSAYTHRMRILEGFNMPPKVKRTEPNWLCLKCSMPLEMATVKLTYLDETFAVEAPACPSCQRVFISEKDAVEKMAQAERMLEDK